MFTTICVAIRLFSSFKFQNPCTTDMRKWLCTTPPLPLTVTPTGTTSVDIVSVPPEFTLDSAAQFMMAQLNISDIFFSIAVFLDGKSCLRNLSFVNRVCYETLIPWRARHLRVDSSDLPSLALFLIRNHAFKYCRSFKVLFNHLPNLQRKISSLLSRYSTAYLCANWVTIVCADGVLPLSTDAICKHSARR